MSEVNAGNEFNAYDGLVYSDLNKVIENLIYLKNHGGGGGGGDSVADLLGGVLSANRQGPATDTPFGIRSTPGGSQDQTSRSWIQFLRTNTDGNPEFMGSLGLDKGGMAYLRKRLNGNNNSDLVPLATYMGCKTLSRYNQVALGPGNIFLFPSADATVTVTGRETYSDDTGNTTYTITSSGTVIGLITRPGYTAVAGRSSIPEGYYRLLIAYQTDTLPFFASRTFYVPAKINGADNKIRIKCGVAGGRPLYVVGDTDGSRLTLL